MNNKYGGLQPTTTAEFKVVCYDVTHYSGQLFYICTEKHIQQLLKNTTCIFSKKNKKKQEKLSK